MKTASSLTLVLLALVGCASQGPPRATSSAAGTSPVPVESPVGTADLQSPASPGPFPRLILPVTGGPPVLGLPVGGNLFVPVTGGPLVPGIPLQPDD